MAQFKPIIQRAERYRVKASIMIEGLTGSGKTGLALSIAYYLAGKNWEKVGMVDTENKSADLIVGQTSHLGEKFGHFLKVNLLEDDGYAPINYLAAAKALTDAGCTVNIFDSTTHAWQRTGGVLDLVNKNEADPKNKGGKYTAWNVPEVTINKNALFEMIRNSEYHVISTVRVKEKFGMEPDETGKNRVKSLGEQQMQSDGLKYEPDLVLSMISAGTRDKAPVARVVKSRYPMLELEQTYEFTPALIEQIRTFLDEGADPDELLAMQKKEYTDAIINYCGQDAKRKNVWKMIKAGAKYDTTRIEDIPLKDLKALYLQLTTEGGQ